MSVTSRALLGFAPTALGTAAAAREVAFTLRNPFLMFGAYNHPTANNNVRPTETNSGRGIFQLRAGLGGTRVNCGTRAGMGETDFRGSGSSRFVAEALAARCTAVSDICPRRFMMASSPAVNAAGREEKTSSSPLTDSAERMGTAIIDLIFKMRQASAS